MLNVPSYATGFLIRYFVCIYLELIIRSIQSAIKQKFNKIAGSIKFWLVQVNCSINWELNGVIQRDIVKISD